jgi:hypothetical protein
VALGGTLTLTATETGDTTPGFSWYVNGVLNGSTTQGQLSGTGTLTRTYTAPSINVPNPNPVTFKIVSLQDNSTSTTTTATVTDTITVSISPTSKSLALGGMQVFTATISNSPNNTALNWYVNGVLNGNTAQGKLSACTTTSPITCTYTAPTLNVPIPNPAVIEVASAADPAKFKTATVTVTDTNGVCESGNESVLNGQYAFNLIGFGHLGFTAVAGSITVDGSGNITGGEADTNGGLGLSSASPISASRYSVGADNRGCAQIVTGFGTFNTRFDLGAISSGKATQGRIMEFDSGTSGAYVATGQILQQTTSNFSSTLSGGYAFLVTGWATNPVGLNGAVSGSGRIACAGVDTYSGGAITAGELYCNDRGVTPIGGNPISGVTGSYSSMDSHGRFTLTTTPPGQGAAHFAVYLVSTAEGLVVNADSTTNNPALGGEAFHQSSSSYTASSLNSNVVSYANGQNSASTGSIRLALGHGDGIGTFTYDDFYEDDAGAWTSNGTTSTCGFVVASNGRVSGNGATACDGVIYLTAANTGVTVGHNATHIFAGYITPQTGRNSFTTASTAGTYFGGTTEILTHTGPQALGKEATLLGTGSPNISVIYDASSTTAQLADQLSTDTRTVASAGTFTTASHGSQVVGLAIDSTHFLLADNITAAYPTITQFGPSSADTVAVSITSPTTAQTVPVKLTLGITAKVTGSTNTGVTWSVNGVTNGNSTYGTISGSGLTVTYDAPTTVPSPATFNITAISTADTSKSASLSVTISGGVVVAMTTPTSAQSLLVSTSLGFTASVTGASNTGVTWSVNGMTNGNSTFGTITGSGLSVTYKAPSAVPSPATFAVKATSTEDITKSASINVTITTASEVVVAITHPSNPSSVTVGTTLAITASVTNAEPALNWTVNGVSNGNSTVGTITGTYPSYTYTPPAAIPGGDNPVTIVATEAGTAESASLTVTVNPSATLPTAISVTGGTAGATGINFSLTSSSSLTLGLADVGTCFYPTASVCTAAVTGIQVSRSGLATANCGNATCTLWLLGEGLTNSGGTAVTSGLTVSVTHGSTTDVTVGTLAPNVLNNGLTNIIFPITVSATAPIGLRDIIVTLPDGETQMYFGAIQIVD